MNMLCVFIFQYIIDAIKASDTEDTEALIQNLILIKQVILHMKETLKNMHGIQIFSRNQFTKDSERSTDINEETKYLNLIFIIKECQETGKLHL